MILEKSWYPGSWILEELRKRGPGIFEATPRKFHNETLKRNLRKKNREESLRENIRDESLERNS